MAQQEKNMAQAVEIVKQQPQGVVVRQSTSLMEVIQRAASDPTIDVNKLERMMALYERVAARDAEQAFAEAMNAAQTETRPIAADASNSHTNSKYASYLALDKALRPIYTKHGFSLSFDTGDATENTVKVLCYVAHSSGHSRTYQVVMPADGKGAKGNDVMTKTHAAGSAMTYGQRYLLKLIFNIAVGDDDDGNAAGRAEPETLDETEIQHLRDLIDRSNSDVEKFCELGGVTSLSEIRKKDFKKCCELLNTKLHRTAARAKTP